MALLNKVLWFLFPGFMQRRRLLRLAKFWTPERPQ
jgi:hypothetical protein